MPGRGQDAWVRSTWRIILRHAIAGLAGCIVLAAVTAMAQPNVETITETYTTPDLNGRDTVTAKIVTTRSRTINEERVLVEVFEPSIEAGQLGLSKRIDRVTTLTEDGSRTVEEVSERPLAVPYDRLKVVRRSVTTMRKDSSGSRVNEQQVFEPDGSGRMVLVPKERGPHRW